MRESDLLRHVADTASRDPRILVPPGDDLAALAVPDGPILTGVDQLIDGRHVDLTLVSAGAAGRKAVRRCVSDLAAMAGRPWAALAAVVLPPDFGTARTVELFDAVRDECARLGGPLVGGDIAMHASCPAPSHGPAPQPGVSRDGGDPSPGGGAAPLVLSITVIGVAGPRGPVLRTGARPGDQLVVTGELGATLAADGTGHHLDFEPRVDVAIALASRLGPDLHAMIDLSDGLGRDGAAVARASGVDLQIDAERLPRRGEATWRQAMGDGEDYELLAAVAPDVEVPASLAGVPLTVIGRVDAVDDPAAGSRVRVTEGGVAHDLTDVGWDHVGTDP